MINVMRIFKLLCLILLNIFSTLEIYDMSEKYTNPFHWCDQSDPIKARNFQTLMVEIYNKVLEQNLANEYDDERALLINCYKVYKEYKNSLAYTKIGNANKHVISFLAPHIRCEFKYMIKAIMSEEFIRDVRKMLLLNIYTEFMNMECHNSWNCINYCEMYGLEVPEIKMINISGYCTLGDMERFFESCLVKLHMLKVTANNLCKSQYIYSFPHDIEICIINESKYPMSILLNCTYIKKCIFKGDFNFISLLKCSVDEIYFLQNTQCRNCMIDNRVNVPTIVSYSPNITIIKCDIKDNDIFQNSMQYCYNMYMNYKYAQKFPDFVNWVILSKCICIKEFEESIAIVSEQISEKIKEVKICKTTARNIHEEINNICDVQSESMRLKSENLKEHLIQLKNEIKNVNYAKKLINNRINNLITYVKQLYELQNGMQKELGDFKYKISNFVLI